MQIAIAILNAALAIPQGSAQLPEFNISGAYIGQSYEEARKLFPSVLCKVSCGDSTAHFYGQPGNLWFGVGNGRINQLAFRFVPTLSDSQSGDIREHFIADYGQPSEQSERCDVWNKTQGKIVLCVSGGMSLAYWHDQNWGKTVSQLP